MITGFDEVFGSSVVSELKKFITNGIRDHKEMDEPKLDHVCMVLGYCFRYAVKSHKEFTKDQVISMMIDVMLCHYKRVTERESDNLRTDHLGKDILDYMLSEYGDDE